MGSLLAGDGEGGSSVGPHSIRFSQEELAYLEKVAASAGVSSVGKLIKRSLPAMTTYSSAPRACPEGDLGKGVAIPIRIPQETWDRIALARGTIPFGAWVREWLLRPGTEPTEGGSSAG